MAIEFFVKAVPENYPSIVLAKGGTGIVGRGADWNPDLAMIKANMEYLERQSCFQPLSSGIVWGTKDEVGPKARGVYADDMRHRWWCSALSFDTHEVYYFPLEFSQIESSCTIDKPLIKKNSAGFAAHHNLEKAISHGYREVIEKKGIYLLWQEQVEHIFEARGYNNTIDRFYHIFDENAYGLSLLIKQMTPDITVCGCVATYVGQEDGRPALVVGCGAGLSVSSSIENAMFECYAQLVNAMELVDEPKNGKFHFYFKSENARELVSRWFGNAKKYQAELFNKVPAYSGNEEAFYITRGSFFCEQNLKVHVVQVLVPDFEIYDIDDRGFPDMYSPFV
ncbi:MAG: hypothetical protein DI551_06930 [Micavibrio aeruginosavorus]|uniref:YcaO domain-containing protein n=1 Tax=Micavibrio aeruginosavorus TaxID=349221 RepID=A0A2W5MWB5_9BACT|nr:MAG: hypothetical protein DI551_06930 [Micavibrio aeruginosavorus]